jgi:hypothetical protein
VGRPSGRPHKTLSRLHVARSSLAAWRRPNVALSRRSAARIRQALRASRVGIGYDCVSPPADLAPSVLNRIAFQKLRWIPLATANTPSAQYRRAIWCARGKDGHLTHLSAHAAVAHVGCCCCHPPNACKCHRGLQGSCIERGPCINYLQDRALIKQNLGPTVGG